jgi:hypothetical protein
MPGVTNDGPLHALPLDDLMPWSVAPLRLGRAWPVAPDAASLRARWERFVRADPDERAVLLEPSRARTLHSPAAQLPGQRTGTEPLARETGPCPEPVRLLHGPYDEQWLIPDQRLLDAARPELWRAAGERQLYLVEQGYVPDAGGPAVLGSAVLPEGRSPAGRPGRIRPLYRRPDATDPNVTPGLLKHLSGVCAAPVGPEDLFAWTLAVAVRDARGCRVPLTTDPELWRRGVELGGGLLRLARRGRGGERPKLPGGRRPYVRAPLPARPAEPVYDRDEEALLAGSGRISPVPAAAWDFTVGGVRVIEQWFARRTAAPQPGTLAAVRPAVWPQEWTSELLELITVLALEAELEPRRRELRAALAASTPLTAADLRAARILPAPAGARRPATVLDHPEEGPGGQFALL